MTSVERLENLAEKYSKSIQGYVLIKYFEMASPIYNVDLELTLLQKKNLTALQEFALKIIKENVSTTQEISDYLGLNERIVIDAVSDLIAKDLLLRDIYKKNLKLTDKGIGALETATLVFPEDTSFSVYIDAITNNMYWERKMNYDSDSTVKKSSIASLMPEKPHPSVSSIIFSDLKSIVSNMQAAKGSNVTDGQLLSINGINKTYIEYKKLNVLMFFNIETQDIEVRVFEKNTRSRDYETAILKQYNENPSIIDFDIKSIIDESNENTLMQYISEDIISDMKEASLRLSDYDSQIISINHQILECEEDISNFEISKEDSESKTQLIKQLRLQIDDLEKERDNAPKIINTYDHRPLLIRALERSKKSVVIVSPWIRGYATDNEIISLIDKALQKKVTVYIGYGISEKEDSDKWVIKKLEDLQKTKYGGRLNIVSLNNTHEKVLISDDDFVVITSFNWLSFKGDSKRGFRQETGSYITAKEVIFQMKEELGERMGIAII